MIVEKNIVRDELAGLVRRLQFARGMETEERRAFLDRELIERQMFGGF